MTSRWEEEALKLVRRDGAMSESVEVVAEALKCAHADGFREAKEKSGEMNTFTDEDLKRLKILLSDPHQYEFDRDWVERLLARLEAAELIVRQGERDHGWRAEYEVWRKAAGR